MGSELCVNLGDQAFCVPSTDDLERMEAETLRKQTPPPGQPRLAPAIREQDWGEQIIGSRHAMLIPVPIARAGLQPTLLSAQVTTGRSAFEAEPYGTNVAASAARGAVMAPPVRVSFAPQAEGPQVGTLELYAVWSDGHHEMHSIALKGSARTLEQPPKDRPQAPLAPADVIARAEAKGGESGKEQEGRSFVDSSRKAENAASALGSAHASGVEVVKTEAGRYQAPVEPTPLWADLAKYALNFGVGAVAGFIAPRIAKAMAGLVGSMLERIEYDDQSYGLVTRRPAALEAGSKLVSTMGSFVEDALTSRAGSAIDNAVDARVGGRGASSVDPFVDYFVSQAEAINKLKLAWDDALDDKVQELREIEASAPGFAKAAMDTVNAGLREGIPLASAEQAAATARGWAMFRARSMLGTDQVTAGGPQPETVTRLESVRSWEGRGLRGPEGGAPGLLDIHVALSPDRTPRVTAARMAGVAYSVAHRFLDMDLAAAQLPIRIVVEPGMAHITRDEVGRVRVDGMIGVFVDPGERDVQGESQAHLGAHRLTERVLSQPLRAWGLDKIDHDDANAPAQVSHR